MTRMPPIVVRVMNDVVGKPFVLIEEADSDQPSPFRLLIYADKVTVEDIRRR